MPNSFFIRNKKPIFIAAAVLVGGLVAVYTYPDKPQANSKPLTQMTTDKPAAHATPTKSATDKPVDFSKQYAENVKKFQDVKEENLVYHLPALLISGVFQQMQETCKVKLAPNDAKDLEALMVASVFVPQLGMQPAQSLDLMKIFSDVQTQRQLAMLNMQSLNQESVALEARFKKEGKEKVCSDVSQAPDHQAFPKNALNYLNYVRANGTVDLAYKAIKFMGHPLTPGSVNQSPGQEAVKPETKGPVALP